MEINGIISARYSDPDHNLIECLVSTSEGERTYAYIPESNDIVNIYIRSHLDIPSILPYAEQLLPLEDIREKKIFEISNAFNECVSGRTTISLGWDMQFNQRDITMVDRAVRFLEMTNRTEGYLTDADNVNHYGLTVPQMKQALLDMTQAYLSAHAHKQELRDMAVSATTHKEIDLIAW